MFMSYFIFTSLDRCSAFVLDDVRLSFGESVMARIVPQSPIAVAPATVSKTIVRKIVKIAKTSKKDPAPGITNTSLVPTDVASAPSPAPLHPPLMCEAETQCEETPQQTRENASIAFADAHTQSLLRVVQSRLKKYPTHLVTSPTGFHYDDIADGIVLCALLHVCNPSWVDFHNLRRGGDPAMNNYENVRLALRTAERELNLASMLEPSEAGLSDGPTVQRYVSALLLATFDRQASLLEKAQHHSQHISRLENEITRYRKQRAKDRKAMSGRSGRTESLSSDPSKSARGRTESVFSNESVSPNRSPRGHNKV